MKEKKQRKNKKRKILLALLLLLLTGAVLGTGTYAWFTYNKLVTVSTIDVNVATSNGLQISADGINFKTVMTSDELLAVTGAKTVTGFTKTYASGINQIPNGATGKLSPVSTNGGLNSNGTLKMFSGSIQDDGDGNNILIATASSENNGDSTGDFIAFDMFLKVNAPAQVYLGQNSKVTGKSGKDTGIQNAARVAFVYQGNASAGESSTNIQGLTNGAATSILDGKTVGDGEAASTDISVKIWEPNNIIHTATGKNNALNVYGKQAYLTNDGVSDSWTAIPYEGVIKAMTLENKIPLTASSTDQDGTGNKPYANYFASTSIWLGTPSATPTKDENFYYLKAGITKFRVYMWVEGQDVDCENDASGGNITLDLEFKLAD